MIVGVLGAGQLGRMLALAGYPLGHTFRFYDNAPPNPPPPAAQLAPCTHGRFDDLPALDAFARACDVITYEFENVPVAAAQHLAKTRPIFPPPPALEVSQDRIAEKNLFNSLDIPTPNFAPIDSLADLPSAIARTGLPAVLKTRRLGYDGKGQAVVRTEAEATAAIGRLGGSNLILESLVAFQRELSAIATRARDGTTVIYPICENTHREGILRTTLAPSPSASPAAADQARRAITAILNHLNYVGTLAVEFFDTGQGLLANEMAPRVHNTGHWTIEGCATSQFENHIRAVTGLPLGSAEALGCCAMVNIIGQAPPTADMLALGAKVHLYGKEPKPGRKIGHATLIAPTAAALAEPFAKLRGMLQ